MTAKPARRSVEEERQEELALTVFGVAAAVFSLPALLLGWALSGLVWRAPWRWFLAALGGVGLTVLLWGEIVAQLDAAAQILQRRGEFGDRLEAAWPHARSWWLLTLQLTPVFALVIDQVTPKRVDVLRERADRRDENKRVRRERRARRGVGIERARQRGPAFALGRHVDGDRLLPTRLGRVRMPLARLRKTVLVVGSPGSGKTETLLRLAKGAASASDWAVFMIDAKGDERTQDRFAALMHAAGREPRLFPSQAYDGWRGDGRELTNRLVQLIDWAHDGGGTYYRDLQTNVVRLACTAPAGPPRSSAELLSRLDRARLIDLWVRTDRAAQARAFKAEHVDTCRQRYASFFDSTCSQLDGAWALEDADCGYLLLNELVYGEETGKLARFLIEDFKQYVAGRKPRGRQVLLIVDEFSAIASGERMARMVEAVRSYDAALVLAPQAYEGMGGDQAAARILNAAHTIFLHAVPEPDPIVRAAGTRLAIEQTLEHEGGRSTEMGSTREQRQRKIPSNQVLQLTPGMCFVIGSGRAQKLQIAPVPEELPAVAPPEPEVAEAHEPRPQYASWL